MANVSDFLRDAEIKRLMMSSAYTPPTTHWIALYTVAPGSGDAGTEVSTVGTGYNRMPLTTADWTTNAVGRVINNTGISYTTAAAAAWGVVVAAGIRDASNAGNLLFHATVSTFSVSSGDAVSISSGGIVLTFTS